MNSFCQSAGLFLAWDHDSYKLRLTLKTYHENVQLMRKTTSYSLLPSHLVLLSWCCSEPMCDLEGL